MMGDVVFSRRQRFRRKGSPLCSRMCLTSLRHLKVLLSRMSQMASSSSDNLTSLLAWVPQQMTMNLILSKKYTFSTSKEQDEQQFLLLSDEAVSKLFPRIYNTAPRSMLEGSTITTLELILKALENSFPNLISVVSQTPLTEYCCPQGGVTSTASILLSTSMNLSGRISTLSTIQIPRLLSKQPQDSSLMSVTVTFQQVLASLMAQAPIPPNTFRTCGCLIREARQQVRASGGVEMQLSSSNLIPKSNFQKRKYLLFHHSCIRGVMTALCYLSRELLVFSTEIPEGLSSLLWTLVRTLWLHPRVRSLSSSYLLADTYLWTYDSATALLEKKLLTSSFSTKGLMEVFVSILFPFLRQKSLSQLAFQVASSWTLQVWALRLCLVFLRRRQGQILEMNRKKAEGCSSLVGLMKAYVLLGSIVEGGKRRKGGWKNLRNITLRIRQNPSECHRRHTSTILSNSSIFESCCSNLFFCYLQSTSTFSSSISPNKLIRFSTNSSCTAIVSFNTSCHSLSIPIHSISSLHFFSYSSIICLFSSIFPFSSLLISWILWISLLLLSSKVLYRISKVNAWWFSSRISFQTLEIYWQLVTTYLFKILRATFYLWLSCLFLSQTSLLAQGIC